jgi:hypothetical protein
MDANIQLNLSRATSWRKFIGSLFIRSHFLLFTPIFFIGLKTSKKGFPLQSGLGLSFSIQNKALTPRLRSQKKLLLT